MSRDITTDAMRKELLLTRRRVCTALAQIDAFLASPGTNTGATRDALLDVRLMLVSNHESFVNHGNDDSDNTRKDE